MYANSPEEAEALLQGLTFEGDDEGTDVYHIRCNNSFGTILTYSEDIIDEADAESGDLLFAIETLLKTYLPEDGENSVH